MRLFPPRLIKTFLTTALLLCLPQNASAQDYTTGLVGHWTLDEITGTTATNSAPVGNNGTLNGGLDAGNDTTSARINTGLMFDGIDDEIHVGNYNAHLSGTSVFTISFWASSTQYTSNPTAISLGEGGATSGTLIIRPFDNSNGNGAELNWGGIIIDLNGRNDADGNMHHFLFVSRSSTDHELFIDGLSVSTNSSNRNLRSDIEDVIIGSWDNSSYFDGIIDDVRIYNRALSAADISALYAYTGVNYTCASPDGVTGEIHFNDDDDVLQYCNSTNWTAIGPKSSLSAGLVGHWTLDETSGASIADSAGSNTGTWTDGVNNDVAEETTTGQNGTALIFDGSDDEVTIPHFALSGTSGLTIASWVYLDNAVTDPRIISKNDTAFNSGHDWALFMDDSGGNERLTTRLRTSGNSAAHRFISSYNLPLDEWHHVAVTYNETTALISMYVDGIFHSSQTHPDGGPIDAGNAGRNIAIGNSGSGGRFWDGMLDDIRVYERALSATDIQKLYNNTARLCTAPPEDLVAHWDMDETSGASIADTTGTNTGTWTDGVNNDVTEETIAGQVNTALSFDETDDIVTVPHDASLDINSAYTVSGWVYFDSAAAASPITPSLISKNNTGGWGSGWVLGRASAGGNIVGGNIRMSVQHDRGISSPNADYSGWVYPVDTWNYVTITWNGSTVNYYLNASLVDTGTITVPPDTGAGDLIIGYGRSNWYNTYHAGRIDDLRIYDSALSLSKIQELYGATGGTCNVQNCSAPFGPKGEIVFNSDYDVMQYCNGSEWIAMGPQGDGGGGCTNPTGFAAELRYNEDINVLQYCEGDEWISAISQSSFSIPTAGLVGLWGLDEASGTTVPDTSGNGYDGTFYNTPTWQPTGGQVDGALEFDSSTVEGVDLPNDLYDNLSEGTISAWIYWEGASNFRQILLSGQDGWFEFALVNGQLALWTSGCSGGNVYARSPSALPTNTWTHVAYKSDSSGQTFYINGTPTTMNYTTGNSSIPIFFDQCTTAATTEYAIGWTSYLADTEVFDGRIDELRVYDRPLSDAEIQALYLGTK